MMLFQKSTSVNKKTKWLMPILKKAMKILYTFLKHFDHFTNCYTFSKIPIFKKNPSIFTGNPMISFLSRLPALTDA